jgi:AcrR family transcriptional regulator
MKKTQSPSRGQPAAGEAAVARKPRGRPRSFDRDAALRLAMAVFWEKGFEATSISDLTEAMGINPPSLYSAFGDKEKLFLEALQRYMDEGFQACPYSCEPTAKGAVRMLLTHKANILCGDDEHPRGCMMALTGACTGFSASVEKALEKMRAGGRARVKARIEQGMEEGDVPAGTDAGALADFVSTIIVGMSMLARNGATRKSLLATVDQAMRVFPDPPAAGKKRRREAQAA